MSVVTASAPGKIVISGEYAVLDGAPAIAAAVTPRARVTIRGADSAHHVVTASTRPGDRAAFRGDGDRFEWLTAADGFGIVEHAWTVTGAAASGSLAIDIDTTEFFDAASDAKLGLGSSAAAITALTAALVATGAAEASVAEAALAAHRRLQRGMGSGVDVACSATGGLIVYRIVDRQPLQLPWPRGLEYALFWSGVAASTTARLEHLSQQAPKRSRVALDEAATRTATAWQGGSAAAVFAAMRAYTEALERFSVDHDLGIFDAGHAGLRAAAGDAVLYKPCGAGGGDVGLALATSADALASFAAEARAAGFVRLDIGIEPQGFHVSREDDSRQDD